MSENFNFVNIVANIIKYRMIIIINSVALLLVSYIAVTNINNTRASISYKTELHASDLFDYKFGKNFSTTLRKMFISKDNILFDVVENMRSEENLNLFINQYKDLNRDKLNITNEDAFIEHYIANLDVEKKKIDDNIYFQISLQINKKMEENLLINNIDFINKYIDFSTKKSFDNILMTVKKRLKYLEQNYESDVRIENKRMDDLNKTFMDFTIFLKNKNQEKINDKRKIIEYEIELARAEEMSIRKYKRNELKSNIEIAKKLELAKAFSQSDKFDLNSIIDTDIPLYIFGYELLDEELKQIDKTSIDDELHISKLLIELELLSKTNDNAFIKEIEQADKSHNQKIKDAMNSLSSIQYIFDADFKNTEGLFNELNNIEFTQISNILVNADKEDIERSISKLNLNSYMALSFILSIVLSFMIIYYRIEKNIELSK